MAITRHSRPPSIFLPAAMRWSNTYFIRWLRHDERDHWGFQLAETFRVWQTSFEHGINSLPFSCFRRYRNFSTLSIAIPRLAFGRAWYCDAVCGYSRIRVSKQGVTDNIGQTYNGTGLYMTPLFVSNTLYQFICFMVLGSLITAHDCIWHHCLFRTSYPYFYFVVLGSLIIAHDCIWHHCLFRTSYPNFSVLWFEYMWTIQTYTIIWYVSNAFCAEMASLKISLL